ncbi:electron transfer flavoprotein [Malaciobacter halophilus]|uniref:Electron transfer flavoprotein n=1 Tax=Malaciobacter halophilus TaxID=197482 RepID=A0A2N1J0C9_9BACT|nr:putative electron transfer flavoprotein FixA [Malaciobacter halophilus]AXH10960.1 electron transfer flavoprotein FixA [Malaciobacter halophilus]PKI80018.1 electron transfer flavoprotein [Malaciobacter halophilus]
MKILVGCKLVPEDQDIVVQNDGTLDMSKAAPKISQFDLNAIQTAVDIKKQNADATITALSVGGKKLENVKVRKDMLSRGLDELVVVTDEKYENLLPHQTSKILSEVAKEQGFDLIICGDGSGDLYAQQTGIKLGALLDVPTVNGISQIVSIDENKVVAKRALENEVETLEIPLPAVICVSADINEPSIPGMKAILAAGKKPVNVKEVVVEDSNLVDLVEIKAPKKKERAHIIVEGDSEDQIAEFVNNLRKII